MDKQICENFLPIDFCSKQVLKMSTQQLSYYADIVVTTWPARFETLRREYWFVGFDQVTQVSRNRTSAGCHYQALGYPTLKIKRSHPFR
jgi:hypothetical protein